MGDDDRLYDVIIIGGGPAGLSAAIYLARANYRTLVVERDRFGGLITITSEVVNYPGIFHTTGAELTATMKKQAESFGAEFLSAEVTAMELEGDIKTVRTSIGDLRCFGVLIATGSIPRRVGFEGEEEFRGSGVAYCATCDGEFFTGEDIFVIGGGTAAAEESLFLTRYARSVTVLIRRDGFTCPQSISDAVMEHPGIMVLPRSEMVSVIGSSCIERVVWKDTETGELRERVAEPGSKFGVFVFAGYEPETSLLNGAVELDESGHIKTDARQMTSIEGVYAAGDVCSKALRQVVTAAGDGAYAATELEKHASKMHKKLNMTAVRHAPSRAQRTAPASAADAGPIDRVITDEMRKQLDSVFAAMERPLELELYLDERDSSMELNSYIAELCSLTDKLSFRVGGCEEVGLRPCVRVCSEGGRWTGLAFHGVPGGHEFTSFILGIYNASGPGQKLEDGQAERIASIKKKLKIEMLVTLSCTMCSQLVTSAQRIAALNDMVSAEVYDLSLFPELRERYAVMSVPCLIINDHLVGFGKKNVRQLLDVIGV